jgi:hypothetical protein
MPTDVQTNLTIAMQTKGFDKGMREMMGVSQKTLESLKKQAVEYSKVQTSIGNMQKKIQLLSKIQMDAGRKMEEITDKTSAAFKKQEDRLERAQARSQKYRKEVQLLARAHQLDAEAQDRLVRSHRELAKLQKQEQQQSRWAGLQGFVQGAGIGGMAGMFMQRGPGMGRQFIGQRVGGLFRRAGQFGAGLAQAPFSGIGGLQQALTSLPGGGILAGQLGAVAQHSQAALQWQRQRVDIAPQFRADPGLVAQTRGQEAQAIASMRAMPPQTQFRGTGVFGRERTQAFMQAGLGQLMRETAAELKGMNLGYGLEKLPEVKAVTKEVGENLYKTTFRVLSQEGVPDIQRQRLEAGMKLRFQRIYGGEGGAETPAEMLAGLAGGGMPGEGPRARFERAGMPALRRVRGARQTQADILRGQVAKAQGRRRAAQLTPFGIAGDIGKRLRGLGRPESAQEVAQLYQMAGGEFMGGGGQQSDVEAAMAAKTMYGVQTQTAGAFMLGGRRGGLVGGRGQSAEALTGAVKDAFELGLTGAEVPRMLQIIAQGIQSFQQTGIPFNKDSLKAMTLEFGKAGIGGVRGTAMAQSLQRYIQGIGQRGISGGLDLMMMQQFGGFQGGGAQQYERAIMQMEMMGGKGIGGAKAGTPMGDMMKRLIEMGGGARGGGVTFMRKAMGRMGMQMGMGEAMGVAERLTGEKLMSQEQREAFAISPEEEARRRAAGGARAPQTPEQMAAMAAKRITDMGGNLKMQADIINKQLAVGSKALTAVQLLEKSSINLNSTFMTLAGETLKNFSKSMNSVTAEIDKHFKGGGSVWGLIGKGISALVTG